MIKKLLFVFGLVLALIGSVEAVEFNAVNGSVFFYQGNITGDRPNFNYDNITKRLYAANLSICNGSSTFCNLTFNNLTGDGSITWYPDNGSFSVAGHVWPAFNNTYDLGVSEYPWRTLYLDNDGGEGIIFPPALPKAAVTDYTINLGGGIATNNGVNVNNFTMAFESCTGGDMNIFTVDMGGAYWLGGNDNEFRICGNNFLSTYCFMSAFGGWAGGEYGFKLIKDPSKPDGEAGVARTMYFDNAQTVSVAGRSIDLRIGGVNKFSVENDGTLLVGAGAAPTHQINSWSVIGLSLFDISGLTANQPILLRLLPHGTATASSIYMYNDPLGGAAAGQVIVGIDNDTVKIVSDVVGAGTPATSWDVGEEDATNYLEDINLLFGNEARYVFRNDSLSVTDNVVVNTSNAGLIIPSGVTPSPNVEGALFLDTDNGATGTLMIYRGGAWRPACDCIGSSGITPPVVPPGTMVFPVWVTLLLIVLVFTGLSFKVPKEQKFMIMPFTGLLWLVLGAASSSVSEIVVFGYSSYLLETQYPLLVVLFSLIGVAFMLNFIHILTNQMKQKSEVMTR